VETQEIKPSTTTDDANKLLPFDKEAAIATS
jgi:hypothetical protein